MSEALELFDDSELKALGQAPEELTDDELFQDGERNPDGPRVLLFRMPVLNLWGKPCGK